MITRLTDLHREDAPRRPRHGAVPCERCPHDGRRVTEALAQAVSETRNGLKVRGRSGEEKHLLATVGNLEETHTITVTKVTRGKRVLVGLSHVPRAERSHAFHPDFPMLLVLSPVRKPAPGTFRSAPQGPDGGPRRAPTFPALHPTLTLTADSWDSRGNDSRSRGLTLLCNPSVRPSVGSRRLRPGWPASGRSSRCGPVPAPASPRCSRLCRSPAFLSVPDPVRLLTGSSQPRRGHRWWVLCKTQGGSSPLTDPGPPSPAPASCGASRTRAGAD